MSAAARVPGLFLDEAAVEADLIERIREVSPLAPFSLNLS